MENYIVSARKYRPSTFDTVVGQRALTTTLKNAIANHKLAHAYLFCGPRGVGKPPAHVSLPRPSTACIPRRKERRAMNVNRARHSTNSVLIISMSWMPLPTTLSKTSVP